MTKEEELEIIEKIKEYSKAVESHGGNRLEIQAVAVSGRYESLIETLYVFEVEQ